MTDALIDAQRISVVVVQQHVLVREGLAALVDADRRFHAVAAAGDLTAAKEMLAGSPRLVLYCVACDADLVFELRAVRGFWPASCVVVLDDRDRAERLSAAVREGARGYLTTRQSREEFFTTLRAVAAGELCFPDEQGKPAAADGAEGMPNEPPPSRLDRLSRREREVMTYLSLGHSVKQCAVLIGLQPSTVDNHKTRLMKKLEVHKTVELVRLAMEHGLVDRPEANGPTPSFAMRRGIVDAANRPR